MDLLSNEAELEVRHSKVPEPHKYREIYLVMDKAPIFIQFDTWKEGDPVIEQWYNMGLWFYLRKANKIVLVGIHNCWKCFT